MQTQTPLAQINAGHVFCHLVGYGHVKYGSATWCALRAVCGHPQTRPTFGAACANLTRAQLGRVLRALYSANSANNWHMLAPVGTCC